MKRFGGVWQGIQVDGDKFVCLDNLLAKDKCIIYSFGISNEWSFEDLMDSIGSIDTAVATMTNFIYIFWFLLFLCIDQNLLKPLICQQQTRTFPVESTDNSEITGNS